MGMAASQARLLALTARIHDVEYQAQAIQNAKMGLANLSDQAYNDYLAALDAQTLTVKDYEGNAIVASFNTLCSKNAVQPAGDFKYALKDSKGHLIVSDDIKAKYDEFMAANGTKDPYTFAFFMTNPEFDLGKDDISNVSINNTVNVIPGMPTITDITTNGWENSLPSGFGRLAPSLVFTGSEEETYASSFEQCNAKVLELAENSDIQSIQVIKDKYDTLTEEVKADPENAEKQAELEQVEETLKHRVYKAYSEEIYNDLAGITNSEDSDFNESDFNYYVGIFKQIQASGGCVSIADYDGVNGDAANDSDWLENMLKCGKITIDTATFDKTSGAVKFTATGVSSDTYLEYATTSSIDKKELAKAEAEYEHACHDIDQKDKKFDLDLTRLETERNALTTEYDSVKKVIQENIERTFGIFS